MSLTICSAIHDVTPFVTINQVSHDLWMLDKVIYLFQELIYYNLIHHPQGVSPSITLDSCQTLVTVSSSLASLPLHMFVGLR